MERKEGTCQSCQHGEIDEVDNKTIILCRDGMYQYINDRCDSYFSYEDMIINKDW